MMLKAKSFFQIIIKKSHLTLFYSHINIHFCFNCFNFQCTIFSMCNNINNLSEPKKKTWWLICRSVFYEHALFLCCVYDLINVFLLVAQNEMKIVYVFLFASWAVLGNRFKFYLFVVSDCRNWNNIGYKHTKEKHLWSFVVTFVV